MTHLGRRCAALLIALPAMIAVSAVPAVAQPVEDEGSELLLSFIAPSGNVSCMLKADYARCDIVDRDWSPPPRPADCEFDYGQGVAVSDSGPAEFVCAGDTTFGVDEVLPYGESMSTGPMRCESAEPGVTCRNGDTGRGFFLSRQSYRLF